MFFKNSSFIEVYDNALSSHECNLLIDHFETSPQMDGMCFLKGQIVKDPKAKKCIEIGDCFFSIENSVSKIIFSPLMKCLKKYKRKYPSIEYAANLGIDDHYNFKKFESKDDGFKVWHTEQGRSDLMSKRVLAWTFYINDAMSGTEFFHYPKVKAKKGRCVIWPAGFTHVHRSEKNKGLKYIISGWVSHM